MLRAAHAARAACGRGGGARARGASAARGSCGPRLRRARPRAANEALESAQARLEALREEKTDTARRERALAGRLATLRERAQSLHVQAASSVLEDEDAAKSVLRERQQLLGAVERRQQRLEALVELREALERAISKAELAVIAAAAALGKSGVGERREERREYRDVEGAFRQIEIDVLEKAYQGESSSRASRDTNSREGERAQDSTEAAEWWASASALVERQAMVADATQATAAAEAARGILATVTRGKLKARDPSEDDIRTLAIAGLAVNDDLPPVETPQIHAALLRQGMKLSLADAAADGGVADAIARARETVTALARILQVPPNRALPMARVIAKDALRASLLDLIACEPSDADGSEDALALCNRAAAAATVFPLNQDDLLDVAVVSIRLVADVAERRALHALASSPNAAAAHPLAIALGLPPETG